jgi:L-asparaginase II
MSLTESAPEPASNPAGTAPGHAPLAIVTRGAMIDAIHCGSVAVVDARGRLLYAAGNPDLVVPTRSSLKPFQAMPLVAAGGIDRFGLTQAQLALTCASHSGEDRHVAAVTDLLGRAGNSGSDLQCGTQVPMHYELSGTFPPPPPYSPLAHNCSGKHAGMLAWCVHCGAPKADYLAFDHPLQVAIRAAVAHFTGVAESALPWGVDGCSAPNYAVPLSALALAFARLARRTPDPVYGDAPMRIADAMTAHPEMVSGEGRNDLAYMRAGRGDWVAKVGAEGIQGIGIRSQGLGIVVKVGDGAKRGLHPAVVAVLDQLGLLDARQRAELAGWRETPVHNYRGLVTGAVRPVVELRAVGPGAERRARSAAGTAAVGQP